MTKMLVKDPMVQEELKNCVPKERSKANLSNRVQPPGQDPVELQLVLGGALALELRRVGRVVVADDVDDAADVGGDVGSERRRCK